MAVITAAQLVPPQAKVQAVQDKQPHIDETVQSAPEVTKDPEVKSAQFAALARKEKAIREMQRNLQLEKEKLNSDRVKEQTELTTLRDKLGRFTSDPYGALLEQGLTSDQVAALMMNQPNPADQEMQLLKKELAALKAANEQTNNKFTEVEQKQYADAVKQIGTDVKLLVDGNESYELIKAMNAHESVVELIESTFKDENRLMSIEEAAKEIEDYLENEALTISRLKKIQSKLAPPVTEEPLKSLTSQKPQTQTLSNAMVAPTGKPLTARERRERAILAYQGKLS